MAVKKDTEKPPIKWGKGDTCDIQGNTFLRAGPRYREFAKDYPSAIFQSIPHFASSGRYAVEVKLFADGDMTKPYISVAVAEDIGAKPRPHLSSIMETRGKSRCIALFSARYTLNGEMATYEDVIDATKGSAENTLTDDQVGDLLSIVESVDLLNTNWQRMSTRQKKKFKDKFTAKKQELENDKPK